MPESITSRFKNAWNAFMNRDPPIEYVDIGSSSFSRPDRPRFTRGNEKSIVTSVYNRIAMDCASCEIKHVKTDPDGYYVKTMKSALNKCFTFSANKDQTGIAFIQDIVMSMFDEGCVVLAPIETETNPMVNDSYDIFSLRTGKVTQWYPDHVTVRLYNDIRGQYEDFLYPKSKVAIIENPFYAVMNAPNSTVSRLTRKLSLLDAVDEQASSGKLDLIIQLPYVLKTDQKKLQAELRKKDIENQLQNSKYGIAYIDATEKITQLNRSVDNNLMKQVEYLTDQFYSQLSITKEIMEGTASADAMQNYYIRTINPIMKAIVAECKRKFLTKTAISQNQSIMFFRNPFELMPMSQFATTADLLTRNAIFSTNEMRQTVGFKPSDDPEANKLKNKNIKSDEASMPLPDENAQIENNPEDYEFPELE